MSKTRLDLCRKSGVEIDERFCWDRYSSLTAMNRGVDRYLGYRLRLNPRLYYLSPLATKSGPVQQKIAVGGIRATARAAALCRRLSTA